jgi:beta-mannosidase
VPVGFRRLEFAQAEGAAAGARPYGLVVNGQRAYLKGWNWVPLDACYGVPRPDKLAHLLTLARDAHVNLLRVWGGGLIETPEFYSWCDRLGLLVWQEFIQSSSGVTSTPADDDDFVTSMRCEAERIVPLRRNHPSLALWCGGNELQDTDGRPLGESAPVLAALRDAVRTLDPDRPFLPSSPSGPNFLNREEVIAADPDGQHDVHGVWEHQGLTDQYRLYDAGTCHLLSEFGAEGMAYRRVIDAVIPPDHRRLPTHADPVWDHLGRWWNNEPLVRQSFGGALSTVDDMIRASQFLQADGLRYAVEAHRRRAFASVGVIPWQFNEPVPNAWCTAAVDHTGTAKPAYHWVGRAYRPRHVCAKLDRQAFAGHDTIEAAVWFWSDEPVSGPVPVRARFLDLAGTVLVERSFTVEPADARAVLAGSIAVPARASGTDVLLLDLTAGQAANRHLLTRTGDFAELTRLARADVSVTAAADGGDSWLVELAHRSGPAAVFLRLLDDRPHGTPGFWRCDDNGIDLLPGETTKLRVRWDGVPAPDRRLRLDGWNITPTTVDRRSLG